MRFFRDSNATTDVLWYFVPDSKNGLPFGHAFSDTVWDLRNEEQQEHLGELAEGHIYSKGFPPPVYVEPTCKKFCGSIDQWQQGALITDPIPGNYPGSTVPVCCCSSLALYPPGGVSVGQQKPGLCFSGCQLPSRLFVNWAFQFTGMPPCTDFVAPIILTPGSRTFTITDGTFTSHLESAPVDAGGQPIIFGLCCRHEDNTCWLLSYDLVGQSAFTHGGPVLITSCNPFTIFPMDAMQVGLCGTLFGITLSN